MTLGFKCNTSRSSLTTTLQALSNNTEQQGVASYKRIETSLVNLWQALKLFPKGSRANLKGNETDNYLTEREKTLLRDVYGLDTSKMSREKSFSILNFSRQTKDQRKSVGKGLSDTRTKGVKPGRKAVSTKQ